MKHQIAILGYGTIGKGVFQILKEKEDFEIKYVFDRKINFNPEHINLFTDNFDDILNDDNIEIVVEVLGGFDFAYDCIKKCLLKKKSVVSANKEVVALKIDELLDLAQKNDVKFLFEASVGGGIPIIKPLEEIVRTSDVEAIYGILNGTTNYILTKMFEGMSFETALKEAQRLGFAEKDPTADLQGLDMIRKINILADLAWNIKIDLDKVGHLGIDIIKEVDINYALEKNWKIKYICSAKKVDNDIELGVYPYYLDNKHPFYGIDNEFNAIMLKTRPNDDLIFIGKGAGSLPTASAIVGDMYAIIKDFKFDHYKNENDYQCHPLNNQKITKLEVI